MALSLVSLPASMSVSPDLSPRLSQVLELTSQGLTEKEIAHKLGLSKWTIDSYMQELRLRLGARNKAQMLMLAVAAGWVAIQLVHGDEQVV
jgi:DNA-binding NarL/FixJ family response regulator